MKEQVVHPTHYNDHPSGVECITIAQEFNFNIGNVIKYCWRAGLKGDSLVDLEKAQQYLGFEIDRLKNQEKKIETLDFTLPTLKEDLWFPRVGDIYKHRQSKRDSRAEFRVTKVDIDSMQISIEQVNGELGALIPHSQFIKNYYLHRRGDNEENNNISNTTAIGMQLKSSE